jgi:hypothetical protein
MLFLCSSGITSSTLLLLLLLLLLLAAAAVMCTTLCQGRGWHCIHAQSGEPTAALIALIACQVEIMVML